MNYLITAFLIAIAAVGAAGCIVHTSNGDLDCNIQVVRSVAITVCVPVR